VNKTQSILIRISPREAGLLNFVSEHTKLSKAEVLRMGLRLIAENKKPSEEKTLKKFYDGLNKEEC